MIKFIHALNKVAMILWTILLGFTGITVILSPASHQLGTELPGTGAGAVSFVFLLTLFGVWFFPMLFMILVAYLTRPQAWAAKTGEKLEAGN